METFINISIVIAIIFIAILANLDFRREISFDKFNKKRRERRNITTEGFKNRMPEFRNPPPCPSKKNI